MVKPTYNPFFSNNLMSDPTITIEQTKPKNPK